MYLSRSCATYYCLWRMARSVELRSYFVERITRTVATSCHKNRGWLCDRCAVRGSPYCQDMTLQKKLNEYINMLIQPHIRVRCVNYRASLEKNVVVNIRLVRVLYPPPTQRSREAYMLQWTSYSHEKNNIALKQWSTPWHTQCTFASHTAQETNIASLIY